ncbi:Histidine kinase [Azospirillaceae bacterium]
MMKMIMRIWQQTTAVSVKFLILLIPVLTLSTILFSSTYFYTKSTKLQRLLTTKIQNVAEINAATLANALWSFDLTGVSGIIQAMLVNQTLECVVVTDALSGHEYIWPEPACVDIPERPLVRHSIILNGRHLGDLTLFYSFQSIQTQIREEILNSFWLLILSLLTTVITALMAHRITIGAPLRRLIESIRLADQKHVRQPVKWKSSDELGQVIEAYNQMLCRLTAEEEALRRSEERLTLAIQATRSSVWDLDLCNGQYWWSKEFPLMLGYEASELPMSAETWENLIHPDEVSTVIAETLRHISGETTTFRQIYRTRRKGGEWAWVEDRATAIRDENGVAIRLTGIMADVTERVQAELNLARERSILQATLENVDQGIVMFDVGLRLVMFNRRAADLLNVPLKYLTQRPHYKDIAACQLDRGEFREYGDDPGRHLQYWDTLPSDYYTYKRRRPDGIVVEVRSNPLFQGGFVCTYTDITAEARAAEEIFLAMQETEKTLAELRATQANLVQAEKMASLALLVAGIAHEINTPVGIAYGCASHLVNRTQHLVECFDAGAMKKSDLKNYVAVAVESSRLMAANLTRAAELIQSFKRVAVDQTSAERRNFDLRTYIDEVITSLGPRLRSTPHQVQVVCSHSIEMNSYPGALSQVLTNLVMNSLVHAFDVSVGGGGCCREDHFNSRTPIVYRGVFTVYG